MQKLLDPVLLPDRVDVGDFGVGKRGEVQMDLREEYLKLYLSSVY